MGVRGREHEAAAAVLAALKGCATTGFAPSTRNQAPSRHEAPGTIEQLLGV
jgi:hypothetical protein